jgi:hypothetical protein
LLYAQTIPDISRGKANIMAVINEIEKSGKVAQYIGSHESSMKSKLRSSLYGAYISETLGIWTAESGNYEVSPSGNPAKILEVTPDVMRTHLHRRFSGRVMYQTANTDIHFDTFINSVKEEEMVGINPFAWSFDTGLAGRYLYLQCDGSGRSGVEWSLLRQASLQPRRDFSLLSLLDEVEGRRIYNG